MITGAHGWNEQGVEVRGSAHATIENNLIHRNTHYGMALKVFTGYVAGKGNTIQENGRGDVYPEKLLFLATEEGGALDRRK
jgi:hypothetical protein